ncbi:hypothetical protein KQH61_05945 [bacterium]|nr:hypothetical protein [bacterium]
MTVQLHTKKRNLIMTALSDSVWVVQRDQVMIEGESLIFGIHAIENTVSAVVSTVIYKDGELYSDPLSGSDYYSGSMITTKTITAQADDGGNEYVVVVTATTDDGTKIWKFLIRVLKPGGVVEKSEIYSDIWVLERNQVAIEGAAPAYSLEFIGASVVSGPVSKVYRNGNDVSGDVQSGSDSVSGAVVTLKTITVQANHAGSIYAVEVSAVVDGNTEKRRFLIYIVDPAEGV